MCLEKTLKIAFVSSIYPKHRDHIYKKRRDLSKKSYKEQQLIIEEETICSMGMWTHHFMREGHEAIMICRNNIIHQNKWCEENGFTPKSEDYEFEIVKEQLIRFKPEILFIFGASYYAQKKRLVNLSYSIKSLKKKFCWYGAPEGENKIFKDYDLVFTNSVHLRQVLNESGLNAQQIDHAFEPSINSKLSETRKKKIITFIGTVNKELTGAFKLQMILGS